MGDLSYKWTGGMFGSEWETCHTSGLEECLGVNGRPVVRVDWRNVWDVNGRPVELESESVRTSVGRFVRCLMHMLHFMAGYVIPRWINKVVL